MSIRSRRDGTFHTQRAGLVRSNIVIAGVLVGSFFVLAIIWFVFVSGFWSVSGIEATGLQSLSSGEVASTTYGILDTSSWKPWDKRNIFLIDPKTLSDQLRESLFAESVAVEKSYPNVLRLIIKERQRSVVVSANSQLLDVDTNGIVTSEATGADAQQSQLRLAGKALADPTHKPVIDTNLDEAATAGYQVTDAATVRAWLESYQAFIASGLKFRYMHLMTPTSTMAYVISDAGYQVIMDMDQPLQPQIETYQKFLRSKPKDLQISQYVDVRVPGKLYVK